MELSRNYLKTKNNLPNWVIWYTLLVEEIIHGNDTGKQGMKRWDSSAKYKIKWLVYISILFSVTFLPNQYNKFTYRLLLLSHKIFINYIYGIVFEGF